jgi:hypothetical protein
MIGPPRHWRGNGASPWALCLVRRGQPLARVAASRAIVGRNRSRTDPTAGRFTRRDVSGAFERFESLVPDLPGEPTVGSRQNVMLAALTLSLLEVLQQAGVERGYAIELTGGRRAAPERRVGLARRAVSVAQPARADS